MSMKSGQDNEEQRIRDAIQSVKVSEVLNIAISYKSIIDQHIQSVTANMCEKNFVLFNLLRKLNTYLHCLASSLTEPTEQIAFATRSILDLNIIARYVITSEERRKLFLAEALDDEIEICRCLSKLPEKPGVSKEVLEENINRIIAIAQQDNLPLGKRRDIRNMAKYSGLSQEYEAYNKLLSKYVHPSSYTIISNPKTVHDDRIRKFFVFLALLKTHDTIKLIETHVVLHA